MSGRTQLFVSWYDTTVIVEYCIAWPATGCELWIGRTTDCYKLRPRCFVFPQKAESSKCKFIVRTRDIFIFFVCSKGRNTRLKYKYTFRLDVVLDVTPLKCCWVSGRKRHSESAEASKSTLIWRPCRQISVVAAVVRVFPQVPRDTTHK